VAASAVQLAAVENGGDLADRKVLVVGAGDVATQVADSAASLGAAVTVCNRTKRHADRFAAAGARVVDLARLEEALTTADVAIFGTAAPHALVTAAQLDRARRGQSHELLVIDLCVPRNVDAGVRVSSGVRLVDLADLRATGAVEDEGVTRDVVRAEQIVEEELDRFLRWRAGRSAAASIRRLRADVEACVRSQLEPTTLDVPDDLRPVLEERVRRAVQQLAHGPTKRILEAAEAGDDALVEALAGLFDASAPRRSGPAPSSSGDRATVHLLNPPASSPAPIVPERAASIG
jgi:glutamyl-tRNA reductase